MRGTAATPPEPPVPQPPESQSKDRNSTASETETGNDGWVSNGNHSNVGGGFPLESLPHQHETDAPTCTDPACRRPAAHRDFQCAQKALGGDNSWEQQMAAAMCYDAYGNFECRRTVTGGNHCLMKPGAIWHPSSKHETEQKQTIK